MSFLPPVLLVVMLFIVKPKVKTSAVIGGHMPTKQIVPRGRKSGKNLEKSTSLFVAMVTKMKSSDCAAAAISSSLVCTKNFDAPCESASCFLDGDDEIAVTSRPRALANLIAM